MCLLPTWEAPLRVRVKEGLSILSSAFPLHQVDDASKLEYQAGDEQKGEPHAQTPDPEKQAAAAEGAAEEDGPQGDEQDGGVNEDTADKHEDRQFAQPEVCSLSAIRSAMHTASTRVQ